MKLSFSTNGWKLDFDEIINLCVENKISGIEIHDVNDSAFLQKPFLKSNISKTNILLTPTQLGGLIQRNLQLLEKEGLHITSKRTANERLWHCSYEEPSENNE